jgi:hypothetical protein
VHTSFDVVDAVPTAKGNQCRAKAHLVNMVANRNFDHRECVVLSFV